MDTDSYHKLCDKPKVFSREELEKTSIALSKVVSAERKLITAALKSEVIKKPELHQGGKETDYILVNIKDADADEIIEELGTLEAQAISPEGRTTPLAFEYASLVDRWLKYVNSL